MIPLSCRERFGRRAEHQSHLLVVVLSGILAGSVAAAHVRSQEATQDAGSDPAVQVFTNVCVKCHPRERVTAMRRTRAQWEEVITTMITTRGAQISDEDFDTVLGYLTRAYGRVNVNRAPAADMVEVLEIPEAVASAIVSYRREHGPFEDFDALAKVPKIDREKLEKKRDAITF